MSKTKISSLPKTIRSIAYEISENMLDSEEIRAAQVEANEAMSIVSALLIEVGVDILAVDVLEKFHEYVHGYGNKEIIPERELTERIAVAIESITRLNRSEAFIDFVFDRAKDNYHEVQFRGSTHYVERILKM